MVKLITMNEAGCMAEKMHGPFVVSAPDLTIPNIFSPNGDGINDFFNVTYTGSQPFRISVKDRWGVSMFETINKTHYWNGAYQSGDSPEGVYFYSITIGEKAYTGHVTLVR